MNSAANDPESERRIRDAIYGRICGSAGVDDDGHCKRCGLRPNGDECPPGFLPPKPSRR